MKTSRDSIRSWFGLLGAVVCLGLVSCAAAPKARPYTIKIQLDPALAGASIQVDLIGANAVSDLPKWETYSVSEYWQPGNVMRRNADKVTIEFGQGRDAAQVLTSADPAWKRWIAAGAMHVVVLADLPGVGEDRAGNADQRRLIVSLDPKRWAGKTDTIEVLVQESGLRLLTPTKPAR